MEKTKPYRIPQTEPIGRSEAPKIYKLEEKIIALIDELAKERLAFDQKFDDGDIKDHFRDAIPQILFDLIGNYSSDTGTVIMQALARDCRVKLVPED